MNGDAQFNDAAQLRRDRIAEIYRDIRIVAWFWGGASGVGLIWLGMYAEGLTWSFFGNLAEWAFGVAMMGATLGFLFGIPKVLQGPRAPAPATTNGSTTSDGGAASGSQPYAQRVNTNLEEISDWLTKIIVGVGLVELKQLPPFLNGFADRIQGSTGIQHHSIALALLAFYGSTGFLFGYLMTRLYLQGALARADQQVTTTDTRAFLKQSDQIRSELKDASNSDAVAAERPVNQPVDDHLRELAKQYLEVSLEDASARLKRKNELALEMYKYAEEQGISREALSNETNEGLILTLATLVHANPLPDCAPRLIKAGAKVTRLHVQYRVTMAISELFRKRVAAPMYKEPAAQLLRSYLPRADAALRTAINATLGLIEAY